MAIQIKRIGRITGIDARPQEVYVVVGDGSHAGRIKTARVCSTVTSPMVKVSTGSDGNTYASLDPEYERMGYKFLRDMYEAEDRLDDYDEFVSFREFVRANHDDVARSLTKEQKRDPEPGFPNELLPKALLDLFYNKRSEKKVWTPSKSVKSKRQGKAASAAEA